MSTKFYKSRTQYAASMPGPKDYPILVLFCTGKTPESLAEALYRKQDLLMWVEVDADEVPEEWMEGFARFGMVPTTKPEPKPVQVKSKPEKVALAIDLEPGDKTKAMIGLFIITTMLLFSLITIVRLVGVVWHAT